MIRLMVRHRVAAFAAWRRVYESVEGMRRSAGVRDAAFFRGALDGDDVTVWHDFDDLQAAKAFVASPTLADAMKRSGVVGTPEIWFLEREFPN